MRVRPLRPRARRALTVGVVVAGCYVAFCGVWLALARREAQAGVDQLHQIRADLDAKGLLDGTGIPLIESAERNFGSARDRARSPFLAPLRLTPVLGRQIESFGSLSAAAAGVAAISVDGAEAARSELSGSIPPGEGRVRSLRDLADIAEVTAARVATVPLGPTFDLVGPAAAARGDFAREKDGVELALLHTRDAARSLADVMAGPSTYLLIAGNNAEMRAGSGMFLSVGLLEFDRGRLTLSDLEPTADLRPEGGVPYRDADLEARWGFAHPNREWRNLGLTPRFPVNAEMAARMWEASGRPSVDGVIAVDVVALAGLLEATGPVEVGGETVTAENAQQLLLHDQYLDDPDQTERRDRLSEVARAVLERFDGSSPDLPALADGLRDSVSGRHLMMWSRSDRAQSAWEQAGLSGAVDDDAMLVGLLNRGGNKLDQYQSVRGRVRTRAVTEGTLVSLRLQVKNGVPEGEPAYIAGEGAYGRYDGFLALTMPHGSEVVRSSLAEGVTAGRDGRSQVLAVPAVLSPGDTVEWRVSFLVPPGAETLAVAPSARVPHIEWSGPGGLRWNDRDTPQMDLALPPNRM